MVSQPRLDTSKVMYHIYVMLAKAYNCCFNLRLATRVTSLDNVLCYLVEGERLHFRGGRVPGQRHDLRRRQGQLGQDNLPLQQTET